MERRKTGIMSLLIRKITYGIFSGMEGTLYQDLMMVMF